MTVEVRALSTIALLIILAACDDNPPSEGDDDYPVDETSSDFQDSDGTDGDTGCLYKTTPLDSTEVGSENIPFTAGDLLTLFEGQQLHHAVYATENEVVEQLPLGGDTILLLTVNYDGGGIRDIIGNAPECGCFLEVDVNVSALTSDTAFAEEVPGIAFFYKNEVENVFQARLFADLEVDALEGGFEIQRFIKPPNPEEVVLFLDQQVDEDGVLLGSVVIMTRGDTDDAPETKYYQHVLTWRSILLL